MLKHHPDVVAVPASCRCVVFVHVCMLAHCIVCVQFSCKLDGLKD